VRSALLIGAEEGRAGLVWFVLVLEFHPALFAAPLEDAADAERADEGLDPAVEAGDGLWAAGLAAWREGAAAVERGVGGVSLDLGVKRGEAVAERGVDGLSLDLGVARGEGAALAERGVGGVLPTAAPAPSKRASSSSMEIGPLGRGVRWPGRRTGTAAAAFASLSSRFIRAFSSRFTRTSSVRFLMLAMFLSALASSALRKATRACICASLSSAAFVFCLAPHIPMRWPVGCFFDLTRCESCANGLSLGVSSISIHNLAVTAGSDWICGG